MEDYLIEKKAYELNPLIGRCHDSTLLNCEEVLHSLADWITWDECADGNDHKSIGFIVKMVENAIKFSSLHQRPIT